MSLPLSFFEAYTIGILNSQYRLECGVVDNEGVDCIEVKKLIDQELEKHEKMDI